MTHTDLLNWQRSSTVKSLSLKWEFFLLKEKKDDDEITSERTLDTGYFAQLKFAYRSWLFYWMSVTINL